MGRVLYLDDEPMHISLVTRWVEALGHSVSSFTSAAEALAAFEAGPGGFDLVLTDMSMPGMSGLEFAQQILRIEPQAVVIIATGCVDPNWADYARTRGVRDVIEKPTTSEAMAKAVGDLLSRSAP